jgi:hypothetical protein
LALAEVVLRVYGSYSDDVRFQLNQQKSYSPGLWKNRFKYRILGKQQAAKMNMDLKLQAKKHSLASTRKNTYTEIE